MKATLFKTLSNKKTTIDIQAGKTLKENLCEFDTEKAVIIVNGKIQKPNYTVKENDIVTVRLMPGATGLIIATIVVAVVAVAAGVVGGIMAYRAKLAAEDAEKELEKAKKLTNKPEIDNRPFLRGASNTAAQGNLLPYVIGRHFLTPYRLGEPFYRISGNDGINEYTYVALACGFNSQIIQKVGIDDITIKAFNDTIPQEGAYDIDPCIFAEDGIIEISQDGNPLTAVPELNYKVESKACNDEIPKDSLVSDGKKEYLTYTLNKNAMNVDIAITFPYGLYAYNDDGDKISAGVSITPQYSLDGGKSWLDFTFSQLSTEEKKVCEGMFLKRDSENVNLDDIDQWKLLLGATAAELKAADFMRVAKVKPYSIGNVAVTVYGVKIENKSKYSNDFERKVSDAEIRSVAHKDFTISDYAELRRNEAESIYIRVRSNGKSGDSKVHNDCYVLYYQSVCFDPDKSSAPAGTAAEESAGLVPCRNIEEREQKFCTVIGLKLKASKINEDKLKKINVITQGVARIWDGTAWSAGKTATRNPAAWALEIETSDRHPASRYDDRELDLESFGEFYEWCETNGYKFDFVCTQNQKKDTLLKHICEATGACIYYDIYGRRAVAVDRPQENALAVYNPQNIITIQNKKSFGRRTDGLRIKYTSSENDLFQEETYIVMREADGKPLPLTDDSLIKDITVTGITTHDHIVKYARRLMAIEILRPKTTIIECGNEGIFYTPYAKVLIQDDSLKIGLSHATIRECLWRYGLLKKIYISGRVTFDPAKTYGIIVNCFGEDGAQPLSVKVSGSGTTDELDVLTQIPISADAKPDEGNVLSFGELDADGGFSHVTTAYVINQIRRSGAGFSLELANYNEAIFDSGTIPEYRSNITQKSSPIKKSIPTDTMTREEVEGLIEGTDGTKAAREAANVVVHGVHFTNIHKIDDMVMSLEEVVARMDDEAARISASISISEEEILMRVDDMSRELVGLIDIQAGAVTALVAGGGAEGVLSLSLELPALIDEKTMGKFIKAAGKDKTEAVYARLDGTDFYCIRGDIGDGVIKELWDKAVTAGLLASQIDLSATQINVSAEHVIITGSSNKGQTIIEGGYLRSSLIEVEKLLAQEINMKNGGIIKSENYNGKLTGTNTLNDRASRGWAINSKGYSEFVNLSAYKAIFDDCTMKRGTIENTVTVNALVLNHVMGYGPYPESWHISKLRGMIEYTDKDITCVGRIAAAGYDDHGNYVDRGGVWVSLVPYSIRKNSDGSITFSGCGEKLWYTNGGDYVLHRAPLSSITFPGATDNLLTGASWGNRQDKWDVWIRF